MSIQIPPDSTGKLVETNTPDGSTHRQVITVGDKTTAANVLAVDSQGRITVNTSAVGNGTIYNGQQAVTAAAQALGSNPCKRLALKALAANTINIYIGNAGVTISSGFELAPGDALTLDVSNSNLIYFIASTTGASFSWIATN